MEIDYENDKGLELFAKILAQEHYLKTGKEEFTKEELEQEEILIFNIESLAAGEDYKNMDYITDRQQEIDNPDPKRQKAVFETLSQKKKVHINLLKNYYESGDLKPMQYYLDRLFEN